MKMFCVEHTRLDDIVTSSKTTVTGSNITTATAAVANNIHTISRAVILAEAAAVDSSLSHNAGLYPPRLCGRSCQPLDQSFPGLLNKCSSSNRETLRPVGSLKHSDLTREVAIASNQNLWGPRVWGYLFSSFPSSSSNLMFVSFLNP